MTTGTLTLITPAAAATHDDPPVTTAHPIVCTYTPLVPAKMMFGNPAPIQYGVRFNCNDAPDILLIDVKLWRYDSNRQQYYLHAENQWSNPGRTGTLTALANCTAGIAYAFHTNVIAEAFHGNWGENVFNSSPVSLRC